MAKNADNKYQIILFYKYAKIDNPTELQQAQIELCKKLGLTGRILISKEGINGTFGGLTENTEKYISTVQSDPKFKEIFANIDWKKSVGLPDAFPRLAVKVKKEIVMARLGVEDIDPAKITGKKLKPEELHQWFEKKEDFTIIDMRNSYEYKFGRFVNSVDPGMDHFSDLNKKVSKLKKYKDKKVLTVCTGGVRCEKASGYLLQKGFKDVYQLDGGMVRYMEKYPGQNFEGSLFVFDKRQNIYFEKPEEHKVIGCCDFCETPTERMRNCSNKKCNNKIIACEKCVDGDRTRQCLDCQNKFNPVFYIKKLIHSLSA